MFYRFIFLLLIILSSCSKYTLNDDGKGNIPVSLKLNKTSSENGNNSMFPVSVYCINQKDFSISNKNFNKGESLTMNLSEGEYSINLFCGINKDGFNIENDFEQKPVIKIKNNGYSDYPLMAAHSVVKIQKATDLNITPVYIVSSVEFELENIPDNVTGIKATISPVFKSYNIDGKEYSESSNAEIECVKNNNKWTSGIKYIFPSKAANTKVSINIDYGNKTKSYNFTLKKNLECGKPYRFTGGFTSDGDSGNNNNGEDDSGEDNDGDFDMEGDFCISDWDMEEEISLDFEGGNPDDGSEGDGGEDGNGNGNGEDSDGENIDIETFYVNEIPSANEVFGPLFIWKSEKKSPIEAVVTVIAPQQFPETLASEAMGILEKYSVDNITGWRMFTENEVHKFFSDFKGGNSDINYILHENKFEVFYYEDKERYLCDNAQKAFNLYGKLTIRKAGEKTKYYLRPVKTMRFIIK